MRAVFEGLLKRLGYAHLGETRHVLAPAAAPVEWTVADGKSWARMMATPTWRKLASMSQDSMIQGLLPQAAPYRDDPRLQQAFILGRKIQMDYLASMAAPTGVPEPATQADAEMIFEEHE